LTRGRPQADRPRFYLDEDVPYRTAGVAAGLGLDIVAARDVHPTLPQDDPFHLETAARDRRIMVTYNRDDFIVATDAAIRMQGPHVGLLILTRRLPRDPARIAHALERWVRPRERDGSWPMQSYEIDFCST
jgi:predicted nuclease of predicted toxin-antitoxin system